MDQFLESIEGNLMINRLTQKQDVSIEEFNEEIKKLRSLIFSIDVPIYYLPELEYVESICIFNYLHLSDVEPIDYTDINKYKNLKTLVIEHNDNINILDVGNLEKLENLIIIGNSNLRELKGIEKLKKLNKVVIVGNNIKSFDNTKMFFDGINDCSALIFDVNMYHRIIMENIDLKKYNISFAEKITVGELYNLNLDMMEELYVKAMNIIKKIIKPDMSTYDNICEIYKYIVSHLTYDYENLANRDQAILYNEIEIGPDSNDYKDINTSYKALKDYKVVCEGYVNLLKFLLNIINIDVEIVPCFVEDDNKTFEYFNHIACRIKMNDEWYYCDPQIEDDVNNLKYFMKSFNEFEKTHRLPDKYRSRSSK